MQVNALIGLWTWLSPHLDTPVGLIFLVMVLYGVLAFIGVSLIEGIVLRLLKWAPLWRSLLDSLLMNLISSAAGYLMASNLSVLPLTGLYSIFTTPSSLLLLYLISVVLETGILLLLHGRPVRKTGKVALIVNLVSYLGFVALGVVGSQATKVEQPTYDPGGYDQDMALSGDHLYLLDGAHGIQLLEVSDRSSPRRIASFGGEDWGGASRVVWQPSVRELLGHR